MPLAISPVALIVFLPFSYISQYSLSFSYSLWIASSFLFLFFSFLQFSKFFKSTSPSPFPIALILVTIFSCTTGWVVFLGQTSIFGASILICVITTIFKNKIIYRSKNSINYYLIFLIFLSGIKPNYAFLSLGLSLIYQNWKETFFSILIFFLFFAIMSPLLELNWIFSYFDTIGNWEKNQLNQFYSWALVPETMNIFRSSFYAFIGDYLAGLISYTVTIGSYFLVFAYALFTKFSDGLRTQKRKLFTKEQTSIFLFGSYLCFAPYAGAYEDFLLLPVFVILLFSYDGRKCRLWPDVFFISLISITLFQRCLPLSKPLWPFFLMKLIVFHILLT